MHLSALTGLIDGIVKEAGTQFYVELLAKPGKRTPRPAGEKAQEEPPEED